MRTLGLILTSSKYFSSKSIPCGQSKRNAFTLMEVMVAVVIISIVIASLLQMMGNSSNLIRNVKTNSDTSQYASFLIASPDYGFENERITIDKLADTFDLDSKLRKKLKKLKAKIIYTELDRIDMSEFDSDEDLENEQEENQVSSGLTFEIGKSTLKFEDSSVSLLRLKIGRAHV